MLEIRNYEEETGAKIRGSTSFLSENSYYTSVFGLRQTKNTLLYFALTSKMIQLLQDKVLTLFMQIKRL